MVTLSELQEALLFVSGDMGGDNEALLNRLTGEIHYRGSFVDDEDLIPADLDDAEKYISIPTAHDLDLGQRLVFRFVADAMPEAYDQVRQIFSRKGAYGRFKDMLNRAGKLEDWHRYEDEAGLSALREWCQENGIAVSE